MYGTDGGPEDRRYGEAGNTGENLLDAAQPAYTLAGLSIGEARAHELVETALARTQMDELKFATLRRSGAGRRNILALFEEARLTAEVVAVIAIDKRWMLASKLIDELVEPRMLRVGQQLEWYASGAAFNMADAMYEGARAELGSVYDDLVAAFVPLVRDYDPARAATFLGALTRARSAARSAETSEILAYMIDTAEELEAEFAARTDALHPALAGFSWQVGHWSELFGNFEVLHDDATTVERWAHRLVMTRGPARRRFPLTVANSP